MSELNNSGPSFEAADPLPANPEAENNRFDSPIAALAEKLNRVDESRFGSDLDHLEQERRLVEIRASWLKTADEHYQNSEYTYCLMLMKDVIQDILISNDLTHLDEAMDIRDNLYALLGSKNGRLVVKLTPDTAK